jgi:hypothetical protein
MASIVWREDRNAWYAFFYDGSGRHLSRKIPDLGRNQKRLARRKAEDIALEHAHVPIQDMDLETAVALYLDGRQVETSIRTYERYLL